MSDESEQSGRHYKPGEKAGAAGIRGALLVVPGPYRTEFLKQLRHFHDATPTCNAHLVDRACCVDLMVDLGAIR
jgi:hypothetical protein